MKIAAFGKVTVGRTVKLSSEGCLAALNHLIHRFGAASLESPESAIKCVIVVLFVAFLIPEGFSGG